MKSSFSLSHLLTTNTEVIEKIEQCIKITLGPSGKTGLVFTKKQGLNILTNGSQLIKSLEFSNHENNLLLKILEQASAKTYSISGDGSTTTLLFSCQILKNSFKFLISGYNSIFLSNGLKKLAIFLNEKVLDYSSPILFKENLFGLIRTSVGKKINNDIFNILENAINEISRDNLLIVENNSNPENELEVVQGIELDKGFSSSYFINNLKNFEVIYENPYILITSKPINSIEQIRDVIDFIKMNNSALVLVVEEINKEILSTLVLNSIQKKLKIVVIRYSSIKFIKTGILEDLSLLTHCNYFSQNLDSSEIFFEPKDLGQAKKVIIKKDKSTFIVSKFAKIITNRRINELSREALISESEYEKNLFKMRIARLSGKIAKIKLGSGAGISNQYQNEELKQKIEATINTVKSTLENGFLPGGGSFYLFLQEEVLNWSSLNLLGDEMFAGNIVSDALKRPFEELIRNNLNDSFLLPNNVNFPKILSELKRLGYPYGYNLLNQKIVNTINENLIDSAKSVRAILWNSITVASLIITTE
jgi:chaperonin GroEL